MTANALHGFLAIITGHWLSSIGAGLVTTSAICWLLALPSQMRGHVSNPYIGILLFVILPIAFIGGLLLIPLGVYLSRRRVRRGLAAIDMDRSTMMRRLAILVAITTLFNIVIASQLTYRAVEHMETVQFCGQTCHVMTPEFTAYQNAVHSRVLCVECHVAPGASGWFDSKVSGTRQLIAVVAGNYPRPVTPAVASGRLVPSAQTCEQCHWPQIGPTVKLKVIPSYKDDEQNTATQTVLLMAASAAGSGIHGSHFGPGVRIRYLSADPKRESLPWVQYSNQNTGETRTYVSGDVKADEMGKLPQYEMQCVDCHNRAAHVFELPDRAVNREMAQGRISPTLPFVKKKSLELLNAQYPSRDEGARRIAEGLREYYRGAHAEVFSKRTNDVDRAAKALSAVYARNVFPDMKVSWGAYPNNLGHTDFPGCFRCHDDGHLTADKKAITQDCASCHEMLAVDEADPEVLKTQKLSDRIGQLQRR
jgi:nitrate/TMAO reductase-like tetraheme cytochrome c subunit